MKEQVNIMNWFNEYSNDIFNFLVYYTGSEDVEDLVQDVFVKAIKKINQFKKQSHPKTWLISIARRTAIDNIRKQRFSKVLTDSFFRSIVAPDPSPPQALLDKERHQHLYQLICELKKPYKDVLILRGLLELGIDETAEALGWHRNKVNITFYRAKQSLRRNIEEKGGDNLESFSK